VPSTRKKTDPGVIGIGELGTMAEASATRPDLA
jgi:hypothetical protein